MRVPSAPKGKEMFKWLGPGFLWMVSEAGSGERLFWPRIGSLATACYGPVCCREPETVKQPRDRPLCRLPGRFAHWWVCFFTQNSRAYHPPKKSTSSFAGENKFNGLDNG